MGKGKIVSVISGLIATTASAFADGGILNMQGCHMDSKTNDYHCHCPCVSNPQAEEIVSLTTLASLLRVSKEKKGIAATCCFDDAMINKILMSDKKVGELVRIDEGLTVGSIDEVTSVACYAEVEP